MRFRLSAISTPHLTFTSPHLTHLTYTSTSSQIASNNGRIEGHWDLIVGDDIRQLLMAMTGCERIHNTPMPFNYLTFLRIFMVGWIVTYPLVMLPSAIEPVSSLRLLIHASSLHPCHRLSSSPTPRAWTRLDALGRAWTRLDALGRPSAAPQFVVGSFGWWTTLGVDSFIIFSERLRISTCALCLGQAALPCP